LAIIIAILSGLSVTTPRADAQLPLDYDLPVPGGAHFFSQTDGQSGATGTGFAVSNADGVPFWTYFQQAGGVPAVGYPVSHRFLWNGFIVQAFQKVVFQWRPEVGTVYYVNVLDEMHDRGLDPWLLTVRQTPPPADWSGDTGLPFPQVVARHLALLDANPAIAAVYFAETDPINRNGLPMAPVQNMGNVLVLRAQRKVFQQWLVDVPWARAGQVVVANGGDLGKESGLYPPAAIAPQPPTMVPLSLVANQAAPTPTPTGSPQAACNGDEEISFAPGSAAAGQTVQIDVTSARPSTNVALTGPLDPVFLGIQAGGKGTIWSWRITPAQPGRLDYNFTISGVVCTTNFVVVGAAAPTATATATAPATATATPTIPRP
jgi:hypothetical protein